MATAQRQRPTPPMLFTDPQPAPLAKRPRKTTDNPMLATCGAGPDAAKCATCVHFTTLDFATGKTHKCDDAAVAGAAKTDWHVRWPACGRYEAATVATLAVNPAKAKRLTARERIQSVREAQAAPATGAITAVMVSRSPLLPGELLEPTDPTDAFIALRLGAFTPSSYQRAVFRFILNGQGDALVNAVAGSGKTSSLVQAAKLLSPTASALFLAFNKHIAEELADRLRSTPMTAKTIHSVGMAVVQANITPKLQIDGRKYNKLTREMVTEEIVPQYGKEQRLATDMLTKLASFARLTLVDDDDVAALDAMMAHYDISADGLDDDTVARVLGAVSELLARGAQMALRSGVIDFTDMIWLPTFLNLPTPTRYDFLFVDEAQDENAAQRELVLRLRAPGGRMVFVGDPRQAIYAFSGADSDAFWRIQQRTNAREMPLSVCYRCPPNVVALAREIVPHIEAAPGKSNGVIGDVSEAQLPALVRPGDLILCRLTAPLISLCIRLIQQRIAARVRGRDIGKQLTDVVNAVTELDGYAWELFPQKLADWHDIQLRKLAAREGTEQQIESLMDRVEAIQTCYDSFQARDAADLSRQLEDLFDDGKPAVMLSTVHRAKGLEEDRVFILRPDKLPLVWPKQQAHQLEQEFNLRYVAITRAKRELYFVGGGAAPVAQATLPAVEDDGEDE